MESRKLASYIETRFPQIHAKRYRTITTGWESIILEINGQYIFRFPRNSKGWARQEKEVTFVKWLGPKLDTSIPNYEFVWWGNKQKLAGYRKIPGMLLDKKGYRDGWTIGLGKDFGRFLSQLHGLQLPPEISKIVPTYDLKAWTTGWPRFYQAARKYAYPLLNSDTRRKAQEFWQVYADHFSRVRFVPTLIHSDLGYGNLVIDPSRGRLSGVIDWEDRQVGDPALDFVGLFGINENLAKRALAAYRLDHDGFEERFGLYATSSAFGETAVAAERKEKQHVKAGIKHIQERLTNAI